MNKMMKMHAAAHSSAQLEQNIEKNASLLRLPCMSLKANNHLLNQSNLIMWPGLGEWENDNPF